MTPTTATSLVGLALFLAGSLLRLIAWLYLTRRPSP